METGRMVVLLNLQNLYESLYDALNQYYVYLGGQKYVDLGLGTHRVKCRVHPDFRLIVIEEKDVVYQRFPIPLINRLEKHYLDIHTVLERWQKAVVEDLKGWVEGFIHVKAEQLRARPRYSPADVFIGYHSDTCASVVLQAVKRRGPRALTEELYQEVLDQAKLALLDCATPDAVVRLNASSLGGFTAKCLSQEYYHRQQHDSFADFLQAQLRPKGQGRRAVFTEVTTFSRLLTSHDCELLESELKDRALKLTVLSLQQFDTEYAFLKDIRNCLTHPADSKILIIQTDFEDGVHSAQLIASAKYSAINEINKMQGNKDSIFVYFITKLSRMASGTSYVGFHGGLWQSVHIDDLRRSTIMVSDVTKLQGVAISQLFKPDDGPELEAGCGAQDSGEELMETEAVSSGEAAEADMETESSKATDSPTPEPAQILDTTRLLRSCIQGAVGKLRDQNAGFERSMQRVSILLGLLDTDSTHTAAFLAVAKMRLYVLLKKQEESSPFSVGEWVVREASNQDALQEAGTFRHTLWKRVQSTVTPLLASMISFIDRDGNLELLASPDSPSWARDLWMFIFSDTKLLNIPVVTSDARSRGEMAYITVQNDMNRLENSANSVPFSWRIKEYLEDLWIHTQYIKGDEGPAEKLVELFRQTPLGRFLAQLSAHQRQDLLQGYLRDFLLLTTRVSTQEELEVLQMALWSCIHQLKAKRPEEEVSLPSVHLAHHYFRSRLQNFSRILAIHPPVVQSLLKGTQNHSWAGHEMALDALAALACVEMLTGELLEPRPQAWQAWLQTVKNLSMPLELLCSDGYTQDSGKMTRAVIRDIRTHWNRLFSVSLFVEHVLLGTKSQIPELLELVTSYISLLNKCLEEDADLKTHRPFVAVMTALRKCKDQASVSFTRPGVRPCPVCLGDAQDPVCLPCDCVFCLRCLKARLTLGQMGCPRCVIDLPDDFSLTVSQEHREIIRKHACFRQMCNSFFVDLVSTMCFKDNSPPEKRVVEDLLSLLFVEKELLRESSQRSREHTKSLSPFDDVVDKTPVIRSVVLKLLLKYSFRDVKDYIQAYLSQLEMKPFLAKDKGALYILFSSCLEDSIREKNSAFSTADEWKRLREEGQFLKTYPPEPGCRAPLRAPGRLRGGGGEASLPEAGGALLHAGPERLVPSVPGEEARQPAGDGVCAEELLAQQEDDLGQMDRYLVHGDDYKALRDTVAKAILKGEPLAVRSALKACGSSAPQQAVYLLLALFREVTTLYRSHNANLHPKPQQCEALKKVIEEIQALSPDVRSFATSLVTNELPLLTPGPGDSILEGTVTEMAVHTAVLLLCGQSQVLEPLRNLAFSPRNMAVSPGCDGFWVPGRPRGTAGASESAGPVCLPALPPAPCPPGPACGMPMEQSHCIDCGAPVGGINHKPNSGFHVIQNTEDRTQTGHVLGSPPPRGAAVVSDRELSPAVFLLLRLLTHLSMLWGAAQSAQEIIHIIKPLVRDPKAFLQQHIQRDLEQLTRMLGKSADETVSVVHLVLGRLLAEQGCWGSLNFDAQLSTREKRNSWEKLVATIILPELEHLDKTLRAVNTRISQDERLGSNPVAKIVYGDPAAFLPGLPQQGVVHCSRMWSCRKRVTVEHLQHIVEQRDGRETVPVLWKFLQKEAELRLVKFLPEILALQKNLVKRFQNVSEVEYSCIRSFIISHSSDGLKQLYQNRIATFLSTWNKLRRSLETNGEIKLPAGYCSSDLDLDADLEVILPRRQGLGLCSTALVSYLISLHNEMVYAVEKLSQEDSSYSVDASEVADVHVVSYEPERDLMPLVLSNCQYHVEQGGETSQEFDLEKIQRQIVSRFLQGKPRLTLKGLPTLVFRRDWNYEHLFMEIRNKMPQHPLPNSVIGAIRGQLQSYSDACEALSAIEVALGFLSTAGGDPNMPLNDYIQNRLGMGDQALLVSQALNRCQLRHSIALWQFLSAHKSELLLRLKKEPFGEIGPSYKEDLCPQNAKLLSTFLNQAGLDAFLLELHEMMVLKLKNPRSAKDFNPQWSLRDTLVSYMETKGSDIPPEMESQFPEEILLSHCVSVWKKAAELKWNRHTR
uniref:RING-type domain-containing protein n=1 Tax=Sus scrofa TaxID=9823 RepID=A0A8D0UTN7_PIG